MQNKQFTNQIGKLFINNKISKKFHGGLRLKSKKNQKKPLVTIITVVKNRPKLLKRCILSVANQSYKNYEHIIIDGGSKKETLKVIKNHENHIGYWISQKDLGIYDAFNKGLNYSCGKIIGFVNSDDILKPNALKILNYYYLKHPKKDFFFGAVKKHWGTLHGYNKWKINFTWNFYSSHSCGFFIKRRAAKKLGYYNLKYKYHADYDYFYRMIKKFSFKGIGTKKNEVFGIFSKGGYSTRQAFEDHVFETTKIRLNNKQSKIVIIFATLVKILFNKNKIKNYKLFLSKIIKFIIMY